MKLEWITSITGYAIGTGGVCFVLCNIYDKFGNVNRDTVSLCVQKPDGSAWEYPCTGTIEKCKAVAQEIEDKTVANPAAKENEDV